MDFSQLFKTSEYETKSTAVLRTVGFICLGIVDMLTMINFMTSIGESWILPFMGGVLVFMKIWNWIASLTAKHIRKVLHLIAWGSISFLSVIAVISIGLAITSVSNQDITKAIALQSLKDTAVATQLKTLTDERSTIQLQINDILAKKAELGVYDKGPAERLEAQLKDARARADELDKKISAFNDGTATEIAQKKTLVNAQLIFSQIFSDALARPAIWVFFFILGVAVELTLTLSSSAPKEEENKKKKKKRPSKPQSVKVVEELQPVVQTQEQEQEDEENDEEDDDEEEDSTAMEEELNQLRAQIQTLKNTSPQVVYVEKPVEEKPYSPDTIEHLAEQSKPAEELLKPEPKHEPKPEPKIEEHIPLSTSKDGKVEVAQFLEKVENKPVAEKEDKNVENFTNVINKMFTKIQEGKSYLLSEEELVRMTGMTLEKVKKIYKYFEYLDLIYFDKLNGLWKAKRDKAIFTDIVRSKLVKK